MAAVEEVLAYKFAAITPYLDERQRRMWLGVEARALGRGGVTTVAGATGVSRTTVSKAVKELDDLEGAAPAGRVRRPGGGRKSLTVTDPGLAEALDELVDPDTRGHPQSPLRWTPKSVRRLADALGQAGHRASAWTVAKLLKQAGYSLQANRKTLEGKQHPDRDAQFRYLADQVKAHLDGGQPVVSVDAKKKELVGAYKNGGQEYQPKGEPVKVETHDFPGEAGKAIPYGVYDVGADTGWVSVGTDHDTASFAVATLRRWYDSVGKTAYPDADRLLICADGGGSNSSRSRAWKAELAAFTADTGLVVTVCHLPPGTSKWNKIEHRLLSHISMNWRGRPLESHEVIVDLIASTTTRTGLKVHAELDAGSYPTGVKVT
ncbi:MAG: ISAzo13 family transposase, partial [Egibacteraceae bacterium]